MARLIYRRQRDPAPFVQEPGWASGPIWSGAENLAPTGIRSSGRTAGSVSLCRLSYPGPQQENISDVKNNTKDK